MQNGWRQLILLAILLGLCVPVAAEGMTTAEWQQLYETAQSHFGQYAQQVAAGQAQPIKCGFPIISNLQQNQPKALASMAGLWDRQDSLSFEYNTTHFRLHYTDQGNNAVYQFSQQDSVAGVPDYIFEAGKALEQVYNHTVNDLGFLAPLSDLSCSSNGSDERIDIYFIQMGYYGVTQRACYVDDYNTVAGYMFLENDYLGFGYGDDRLSPLRVTAAHEFFHLVQFAYDINEEENSGDNPAWMEMTATFMEEENYDNVNDYYNYLPYFYYYPQWSLRTGPKSQDPQGMHMYASVVFPIFLSENFGTGIIRDIWERCAEVPGPNWWLATDDAIRAESEGSSNFRKVFKEFTLWNLFVGDWARDGSYFSEAANYPSPLGHLLGSPTVRMIVDEISDYPAVVTVEGTLAPDNLGANYILLDNLSLYDSLALTFGPNRTKPWGLLVVGLPADVGDPAQPIYVDPNNYDSSTTESILIPNASSYDRIALIPSVTGGNSIETDYRISIAPAGDKVFHPSEGETIALRDKSTYQIKWYLDRTVSRVWLGLSIDNGATWRTIDVVDNELSEYVWRVPNISSDSCFLRVANVDDLGQCVESGRFSISQGGGFDPYPNPAKLGRGDKVRFVGEVSTDADAAGVEVSISILTLAGEKVRTLKGTSSGGTVTMEWDLTNENGETVAAGPYLAVIRFAGEKIVKKLLVL